MNLKITSRDSEWNPKYFGVITGLFCGLYMITAAINVKMIDVYGFILPGGILTFPLCCIITDLLTEVYGFNRTRQAIWTVLACTVLFAVFTQWNIVLKPADFWPHQTALASLFDTTWRLAAAGCLAWLAGEFVNSYVMSRLKIFQNARHMAVRFIGSTAIGQFFDTIVFMTVAFAGTMPWDAFPMIVLTVWGAKVLYEIVALPLSIPVTRWIKRKEGVEHFDRQALHIV